MAQPKAVDRAGENPSWPKKEARPLTNGTGGNGQPPGLRSLDTGQAKFWVYCFSHAVS